MYKLEESDNSKNPNVKQKITELQAELQKLNSTIQSYQNQAADKRALTRGIIQQFVNSKNEHEGLSNKQSFDPKTNISGDNFAKLFSETQESVKKAPVKLEQSPIVQPSTAQSEWQSTTKPIVSATLKDRLFPSRQIKAELELAKAESKLSQIQEKQSAAATAKSNAQQKLREEQEKYNAMTANKSQALQTLNQKKVASQKRLAAVKNTQEQLKKAKMNRNTASKKLKEMDSLVEKYRRLISDPNVSAELKARYTVYYTTSTQDQSSAQENFKLASLAFENKKQQFENSKKNAQSALKQEKAARAAATKISKAVAPSLFGRSNLNKAKSKAAKAEAQERRLNEIAPTKKEEATQKIQVAQQKLNL